jgi:hypothetical protein
MQESPPSHESQPVCTKNIHGLRPVERKTVSDIAPPIHHRIVYHER